MAKVSLYPERETVSGTDQLYLFAEGRDWRAKFSTVLSSLLGGGAFLEAGTAPGNLVSLDANGLIPLGLLPEEALSGGEGGGTGDVIGPSGATADHVAVFDGPTGKVIKAGPALGSAAELNAGTGANEVLKLDGDGRLDASLVKNLPTVGGPTVTDYSLPIFPESYAGTARQKITAAATAAAADPTRMLYLKDTYEVDEAITLSIPEGQKLRVRGPGVIKTIANIATTLSVIAVWPAAVAATAAEITTRNFPGSVSGATECWRITVPGNSIPINALVKVVADDAIPGEINASRRVGEVLRVADKDGGDLYLAGRPIDSYATNIRVQRVPEATALDWDGPTFAATPGQTGWRGTQFVVRGFVGGRIRSAVDTGYDIGLQLQSCVQTDVRFRARDMLNRIASLGSFGYGVQDCCGWFNRIDVDGSANVRHASTTGTFTASAGDDTWKYGRVVGSTYTGSVMASTGAALDLHPSAYGCTLYNVGAPGSIIGEDSAGAAYQLRGRFSQIINGFAAGTQHGLQVWAQADGDCWDQTAINWRYTGYGDSIRVGSESTAYKVQRFSAIGGVHRCSNLRTFFVNQVDNAMFDSVAVRPFGSNSGACGWISGAGVDVLHINRPRIDLAQHTGNFDLVSFTTGVNANTLIIIDSPILTNWSGKLRSWVNGAGTTNRVLLINLPRDVIPSIGDVINGGSLASVEKRQYLDGSAGLTRAALQTLAASTAEGPAAGDALAQILAAKTGEQVIVPPSAALDPSHVLNAARQWVPPGTPSVAEIRAALGIFDADGKIPLSNIVAPPGYQFVLIASDPSMPDGTQFIPSLIRTSGNASMIDATALGLPPDLPSQMIVGVNFILPAYSPSNQGIDFDLTTAPASASAISGYEIDFDNFANDPISIPAGAAMPFRQRFTPDIGASLDFSGVWQWGVASWAQRVRLRAVNAAGGGPWSDWQTVTVDQTTNYFFPDADWGFTEQRAADASADGLTFTSVSSSRLLPAGWSLECYAGPLTYNATNATAIMAAAIPITPGNDLLSLTGGAVGSSRYATLFMRGPGSADRHRVSNEKRIVVQGRYAASAMYNTIDPDNTAYWSGAVVASNTINSDNTAEYAS